jgi:hypothetical protein
MQLELAMRLGFCTKETQQRIAERVHAIGRMLNGLIESQQRVEADWQ